MKALYGLRQSARAWYEELVSKLLQMGFRRSTCNHSVFYQKNESGWVILTLHTDNITGVGSSTQEIEKTRTEISKVWKFKEKNLDEPVKILGILLQRTYDGSIHISQPDFIVDALQQYNYTDATDRTTPGNPNTKLTINDVPFTETEENMQHRKLYQSVIGTLQYAASATRPDIAFCVRQLAQYNQNPSGTHMTAAFDILHYLKHTKTYGITYSFGPSDLLGYCDANYANNLDTRKSTSAYIFLLAGGPVNWSSKSQSRIAQSTTEAEYTALNHAGREAIWLRNLSQEIGLFQSVPAIPIHTDNAGAVALANNPVFHARTKHIAIEGHWVREIIADKLIRIVQVPTALNVADILTKPLPQQNHYQQLKLLNFRPFEDLQK